MEPDQTGAAEEFTQDEMFLARHLAKRRSWQKSTVPTPNSPTVAIAVLTPAHLPRRNTQNVLWPLLKKIGVPSFTSNRLACECELSLDLPFAVTWAVI